MRIRNEEILRLRQHNCFSQDEVADKCKIDVRTYRRWERGDVNKGLRGLREFIFWKQADILERLAAVFEVAPEALVDRNDIDASATAAAADLVRRMPTRPPTPSAPGMAFSYVPWDEQERRAAHYLRTPGQPVVLQGPWRSGKSTLLSYLLRQAHAVEPQALSVRLCLSELDRSYFASLDTLLRTLGHRLLRAVDGASPQRPARADERIEECWRGPDAEKSKLTWLVERHVLAAAPRRLLLSIERADRLEDCPFRHDFFALLRGWAEKKTEDPWSQLRLLVTIATEHTLLEDAARYSPFFALAKPIRLEQLLPGQVAAIAAQHGLDTEAVAQSAMSALLDLVGPHPHLIYLALEEAEALAGGADSPRPDVLAALNRLLEAPTGPRGVFHDHLASLDEWLRRNPGLRERFVGFVRSPSTGLPFEDYCRLYSAGILVREGGAYRLRCRIYEDHFRALAGAAGPGA